VTPTAAPVTTTTAATTTTTTTVAPTTAVPADAATTTTTVTPTTDSPATTPAAAMAVRPGCGLADGEVYKTDRSVTVEYLYELQHDADKDALDVAGGVDARAAELVKGALIDCGGDGARNLRTSSGGEPSAVVGVSVGGARSSGTVVRRGGRREQVDGIEAGGSPVLSDRQCEVIDGSPCETVLTEIVLYLREGSTTPSEDEATTQALTEIESGMGGDAFDGVDGVIDVAYVGAPEDVAAAGAGPTGGAGAGIGVGTASAAERTVNTNNSDDSSLGPLGISMIALSALVVALVALLLVRKKKKTEATVEERFLDDMSVNKDFGKMPLSPTNTDSTHPDLASPSSGGGSPPVTSPKSSWRKSRAAHVLTDGDDSIYSSPVQDNGTDPGSSDGENRLADGEYEGPEISDLGGVHSGINVHSCTSATCEICGGQGIGVEPTFVPSMDDVFEDGDSVLEGYSDISGGVNRTPSRGVRPPGSHYADRRAYPMEDTVDF